jgi:hypothetical protein
MEEGDQTDIILLDFAKAFDKVPHDRLLYEMEFYGVRQNTLKWILVELTFARNSDYNAFFRMETHLPFSLPFF